MQRTGFYYVILSIIVCDNKKLFLLHNKNKEPLKFASKMLSKLPFIIANAVFTNFYQNRQKKRLRENKTHFKKMLT